MFRVFTVCSIYRSLVSSLIAKNLKKTETLSWILGAGGVALHGFPCNISAVASDYKHRPGTDNIVLCYTHPITYTNYTIGVVLPNNKVLLRPQVENIHPDLVYNILMRFTLNFHMHCCVCDRIGNHRVCEDCVGIHSTIMMGVLEHARATRKTRFL